MMETLRSSETSVLTSVTRRNVAEDGILHSHRGENLKSYINFGILTPRNNKIQPDFGYNRISFLQVSTFRINLNIINVIYLE
jgi:hypothetical protein